MTVYSETKRSLSAESLVAFVTFYLIISFVDFPCDLFTAIQRPIILQGVQNVLTLNPNIALDKQFLTEKVVQNVVLYIQTKVKDRIESELEFRKARGEAERRAKEVEEETIQAVDAAVKHLMLNSGIIETLGQFVEASDQWKNDFNNHQDLVQKIIGTGISPGILTFVKLTYSNI